MRTLIRASQLHPDVSGLIINYSTGSYLNYNNVSGVSGIETVQSGSFLLITPQGNENVREINNLTGSLSINGESGIYTRTNNQTIYVGYSGGAGSLQLISGYGNIDVWKINNSTYGVSGISITGTNGIETFYNPFKTLLTIRGAGIGTVNNNTGNINFIGTNGIQVQTTGQSILIDGSVAAKSGVNSLNTLNGSPISITGGQDIGVTTSDGLKTIYVAYSGIGWGENLSQIGNNSSVNYIGNDNTIQESLESFLGGKNCILDASTGTYTLNDASSQYTNILNSTFINCSGNLIDSLTGATLINARIDAQNLKHPYSLIIGGSSNNTFSAQMQMKAFLSGKEVMKTFVVPKTKYSGLYISTGTVLFGSIDYVAVRYDVTNFTASFDPKNFGIYGKKNFLAQRATNLQVEVKDESDLFGGIDKYGIFLSGGNDENLYLWASGYSGNDPGDGLDGVHDVIFMANLNFTNFSIYPNL